MKIIIDIPEEYIEHILDGKETFLEVHDLVRRVANGTPLPKGYGRLVDISPYEKKDKNAEPWELRRYVGKVVKEPEIVKLSDLPTIIEKDRSEEDAVSN